MGEKREYNSTEQYKTTSTSANKKSGKLACHRRQHTQSDTCLIDKPLLALLRCTTTLKEWPKTTMSVFLLMRMLIIVVMETPPVVS